MENVYCADCITRAGEIGKGWEAIHRYAVTYVDGTAVCLKDAGDRIEARRNATAVAQERLDAAVRVWAQNMTETDNTIRDRNIRVAHLHATLAAGWSALPETTSTPTYSTPGPDQATS